MDLQENRIWLEIRKIYSTVTEHIFVAEKNSNKRMTKLHKKKAENTEIIKGIYENECGTAEYGNKPQHNCTTA